MNGAVPGKSLNLTGLWFPKQAPSSSFRIRIKLNSKEAERRLTGVRFALTYYRNDIIGKCRLMEPNGRLLEALLTATQELHMAIGGLRSCNVGEREYLGRVVLLYEDLAAATIRLLRIARPYTRSRRGRWALLNARAGSLAAEINWSFGSLRQMGKLLQNDSNRGRVCQSSTWTAWIASWVCIPSQRKKASKSGGKKLEEHHHEREHVFTNKKPGEACKCLDYR